MLTPLCKALIMLSIRQLAVSFNLSLTRATFINPTTHTSLTRHQTSSSSRTFNNSLHWKVPLDPNSNRLSKRWCLNLDSNNHQMVLLLKKWSNLQLSRWLNQEPLLKGPLHKTLLELVLSFNQLMKLKMKMKTRKRKRNKTDDI